MKFVKIVSAVLSIVALLSAAFVFVYIAARIDTEAAPPVTPAETLSEPIVKEDVVTPPKQEVPAERTTEPETPTREHLVTALPEPGAEPVVEEEVKPIEKPAPEPATEPVKEPAPTVRYALTDAERAIVESVVMAEAGGECYEGQMLVAQCILNGSERSKIRPDRTVIDYQYTKARPKPSQSVKDAVSAVFDRGEVVVEDIILWFYAPKWVTGTPWHEAQRFVIEVGGHKFFAMW